MEIIFRDAREGGAGKDRSQWSNFWADNYTDASIIGFLDGEEYIHTPVILEEILTKDTRLINGAFVGDHWGDSVDNFVLGGARGNVIKTTKAPFDIMWTNRFPIWLWRSSLRGIRESITARFSLPFFDMAFGALTHAPPTIGFDGRRKGYSQFNLMLNHVFFGEADRYLFRLLHKDSGVNFTRITNDVRRKKALETGVDHLDLGCDQACYGKCIDRVMYSFCSLHTSKLRTECEPYLDAMESLFYCAGGVAGARADGAGVAPALNKTLLDPFFPPRDAIEVQSEEKNEKRDP